MKLKNLLGTIFALIFSQNLVSSWHFDATHNPYQQKTPKKKKERRKRVKKYNPKKIKEKGQKHPSNESWNQHRNSQVFLSRGKRPRIKKSKTHGSFRSAPKKEIEVHFHSLNSNIQHIANVSLPQYQKITKNPEISTLAIENFVSKNILNNDILNSCQKIIALLNQNLNLRNSPATNLQKNLRKAEKTYLLLSAHIKNIKSLDHLDFNLNIETYKEALEDLKILMKLKRKHTMRKTNKVFRNRQKERDAKEERLKQQNFPEKKYSTPQTEETYLTKLLKEGKIDQGIYKILLKQESEPELELELEVDMRKKEEQEQEQAYLDELADQEETWDAEDRYEVKEREYLKFLAENKRLQTLKIMQRKDLALNEMQYNLSKRKQKRF